MKPNHTPRLVNSVLLSAALAMATMLAAPARAQMNGENLLGDMGVRSGSQPAPGIYLGNVYYRYFTNTIKGPDGSIITFDPTAAGSQTIDAAVPMAIYISKKKMLGAHFGTMAVMPFASGALEAPGLGFSETASAGASDLYVMPAQLGWHWKRADAVTGFAFFAPTGRHTAGASDNLGKGMWSYEVSGGSTVYLDSQRSVSVATTAYWETHSKKDGTIEVPAQHLTIGDIKVGQLMTLEGGVGKSFLQGAASVGAAYYAQWKLTPDEIRVFSPVTQNASLSAKHRVFGFGPDVTIPVATKTRVISLLNVRYLWEAGAETKTQGRSLLITATFPVGGIKIPGK